MTRAETLVRYLVGCALALAAMGVIVWLYTMGADYAG